MREISPELVGAGDRVTLTWGCRGIGVSISIPEGGGPRRAAGARGSKGRQTGSACSLAGVRGFHHCPKRSGLLHLHSHGSPNTGNSPASSHLGNLFWVCLLLSISQASCVFTDSLTASRGSLLQVCLLHSWEAPEVSPSRQIWVRLNVPVGCVR